MRKKILAIVFAALLAIAMAVPTFAQDEDPDPGQEAGEQANAEQVEQGEDE